MGCLVSPIQAVPPPPKNGVSYGSATPNPKPADQEVAKKSEPLVGFGLDVSCGTIEPSINLGGGFGIGLDGHLTINL